MRIADLRAVLAALAVVAVGLFGEVGWPLVYLCAGVSITVISAGFAADHQFGIRLEDLFWWAMIGWGVVAALGVSGGALESKATLATWTAAWVIWAAGCRATSRGRRDFSVFLVVPCWISITSLKTTISNIFWSGMNRLLSMLLMVMREPQVELAFAW